MRGGRILGPFLRIAWRECGRHRRRSALVLALVAFPVAVAAGAITARSTIVPTPQEERLLEHGSADLVVRCRCTPPPGSVPTTPGTPGTPGEPVAAAVEASLRAALPPGARVVPVTATEQAVVVAGARAPDRNQVLSTDPADPIHRSRFRVDAGRAPRTPGEATVSPVLARELDVKVGDTITLHPGGDALEVVGLVRERARLRHPLVTVLPGRLPSTTWWVDLPAGTGAGDLAEALPGDVVATPVAALVDPPAGTVHRAAEISLAYLAGIFVFLWTGVVAAAAFAMAARGRLRQLGLVAANGGSPRQVRRLLVADAAVLGLAGSLIGAVAGVIGAAVVLPRLEGTPALHHETGSLQVPVLAVAGAVIVGLGCSVVAGLLPAARAARIPTTAALQGRIERPPHHLRSAAAGLVTATIGILLIGQGARAGRHWPIAAGTGLVVLAVALLNRPVVAVLARLARGAGLSVRFVARDAARNAQRTGPAVVASMLAVAAVVGVLTIVRSDDATRGATPDPVERQLSVTVEGLATATPAGAATAPAGPSPVAGALSRAAAEVLPTAEVEMAGDRTALVRLERRPTGDEVQRLRAGVLRHVDGIPGGDAAWARVEAPGDDDRDTRPWQLATVVAGSILALIVLSLVAALSRAETRAEMATLHVLGIAPARHRRLAAAAAGLLALVAGVMGVPAGLVPAVAFLQAKYGAGIEPVVVVPWAAIAAQVTGLALLLATFGWLTAGRQRRSSP